MVCVWLDEADQQDLLMDELQEWERGEQGRGRRKVCVAVLSGRCLRMRVLTVSQVPPS